MAIHLKTSMKLSQSLRITPQLQQAIKLLQLSRMELETEVRKELVENPVLEEVQDSIEASESKSESAENASETQGVDTPEAVPEQNMQDPTKQDEFEWESYLDNKYKPPSGALGGGDDEIINYENMISVEKNLFDHLMWQMGLSGFNDEEQLAASIIISYIEDDGYIKAPLEEIAKTEDIDVKELEEILPFIHEMDPPGVGCRNLQECLLIQAKHLEEDTHDMVHIIANHIKELERKNYRAIAKAMDIDLEDVIDICKIIYSMDPKPGRVFASSDTQFVTPDVHVYKVNDEYMISLNEEGLPRLRVSNLYRNILTTKGSDKSAGNVSEGDKQTRDYIQDKLKSAVWLIKSIHQRQRTIYKVAESIVKHQHDFFEKGSAFIKPMILRDVANDIGMHESTVSRVTTSKYMHTPQGIYELKYFFNSGISRTDGDSLASESVKLKIKALVSDEDPKKPLSDQKIVDHLKKEGINIARRTVAKYRDVLKILPSSKRKKMF
ncbi:MAG: RNA polymerase factor sigma-54 [Bdellovibrionaceae bacterium]|nr:RNA polymerase factor sigma-54 [Pseudobdellovibrionaceae bacterium]